MAARSVTAVTGPIGEMEPSWATLPSSLGEAAGLAAEPAVVPGGGQSWRQILRAADEHGAEVVVCGCRGRGAVTRSVLGSAS